MSALCSTSAKPLAVRPTSGKAFCAPSARVPVRANRTLSVSVRAAAEFPKPAVPKGVSLPSRKPDVPPPMFGFVSWAEKMNSRAAMIGFFALLAVEGITGKGLLELLGADVGNGLGFQL